MIINPKVTDLSHYDDVDTNNEFMPAYRFGIRGVINKVSEGRWMQDHSFQWRRNPAKQAGMLYGGYHFLRPGNMKAQAEWFLSLCGNTDDLLLAGDHEDRNVDIDAAQQWFQYVHDRVGRWPALYSGFLIKEQVGDADRAFWSKIRLWLSHYSTRPSWPKSIWQKPWLWQYTGDGHGPLPHTVPGITPVGKLDINSYDSTDTQLKAEWLP